MKPEFRELMALHSIFERGLWVPRRHMFVAFGGDAPHGAAAGYVIRFFLRHQGVEVVVDVNSTIATEDQFVAEWREACLAYNELPQADREEIMQSAHVRRHAGELLAIAVIKGIKHPCDDLPHG